MDPRGTGFPNANSGLSRDHASGYGGGIGQLREGAAGILPPVYAAPVRVTIRGCAVCAEPPELGSGETTDRKYFEKGLFVRKQSRESLDQRYENRNCPALSPRRSPTGEGVLPDVTAGSAVREAAGRTEEAWAEDAWPTLATFAILGGPVRYWFGGRTRKPR